MKRIQSKSNQLETLEVSLSCFDDKLYIVDDGIKILVESF